MGQRNSQISEFLQPLFANGEVVFRAAPEEAPDPDRAVVDWLEQKYADYRSAIAGPPLKFCAAVAWSAAQFVRHACWFSVHRGEPVDVIERRLAFAKPRAYAEQLSADMLLRYLPQLHRRCRSINPADPLVTILAQVMREWPLSGVLSDVEDAPMTPPNWDDHIGLAMLYAERLARNPKHEWQPKGATREIAEVVFADLGTPWPWTTKQCTMNH